VSLSVVRRGVEWWLSGVRQRSIRSRDPKTEQCGLDMEEMAMWSQGSQPQPHLPLSQNIAPVQQSQVAMTKGLSSCELYPRQPHVRAAAADLIHN
jgi:hypothetical protein